VRVRPRFLHVRVEGIRNHGDPAKHDCCEREMQRDSPQVYVALRSELCRAESEHLIASPDAYIFRRTTVLIDSSAMKGIEMRIEHSLPPGLLGG
jgi:hypothetical protein